MLTIHGNMRLIAVVNKARPFSYQWLTARLEAFTIPRSDGVVCITRYTRNAVANLAKRTWVVHNAVDHRFFDVNASSPKGGSPVILCVGNVCSRKNQNNFIRALDTLAQQRALKLVFLGHASRDDAYGREFFQLIGTRPWCEHAGFADREKLKDHFRQATLLMLPSLDDIAPWLCWRRWPQACPWQRRRLAVCRTWSRMVGPDF